MAREDLHDDLHEQVVTSVEDGAKMACEGEILDGEGFFYPSAVLENIQPEQPAYEEEFLGR